MVDKNSPVPLYHQIKEDIIGRIDARELLADQRVMSEFELVEEYGVSQITVRKAISELVTEGYLYRIRGKGTYVAHKRQIHRTSLLSFSEELRRTGYVNGVRDIEIKKENNARIAGLLGLVHVAPVYKIRRVRLRNGEPIGLQTSYLPADLVPFDAFDDFDESKSVYQTLERHGVRPMRAHETYRAILIDNEVTKKQLDIEEDEPGFFVSRFTYDENQKLFEYAESILRGTQYELETDTYDK